MEAIDFEGNSTICNCPGICIAIRDKSLYVLWICDNKKKDQIYKIDIPSIHSMHVTPLKFGTEISMSNGYVTKRMKDQLK